jgi:hypothetical protein
MAIQQMPLFGVEALRNDSPLDWTFRGQPTRELTHCYHDYPARMILQIADQVLRLYAPAQGLLFDPYCRTGTTLVEGVYCRGGQTRRNRVLCSRKSPSKRGHTSH